jgi:hypothetical protein
MVVTENPPRARGFVSRASVPKPPQRAPYVRIRRQPHPTKLSSENLESSTIDAIAHVTRPTTGSSSSSAGEHSVISIRFDVARATGSGKRWRAGAVSQVVRPPNPRQTLHQGPLYKWGLRWGIQINSEGHIREIKIIGVRKIYNIFLAICKMPGKIRNRYHIYLTRIAKG